MFWDISYQKAVEELVHKETQDADDGVAQMVDEEHVHNNCFVALGECPLVPHKTYKKDQLVEQLKGKKRGMKTLALMCGKTNMDISPSNTTYIDSTQQQQSRAEAHSVDGP